MTRTKLNIPKPKDNFESVPFVLDMTQYQLKVFIKRMWKNLQDLATSMDSARPDVANLLDNMMDGNSWNEKDLRERYVYTIHKDELVEYDSKLNTFTSYNADNGQTNKPTIAMTKKEMKQTLAKLWHK